MRIAMIMNKRYLLAIPAITVASVALDTSFNRRPARQPDERVNPTTGYVACSGRQSAQFACLIVASRFYVDRSDA
ncbi:hypothetical protein OKW29_000213 [Paraburkholderia sp. CI3]